MSVPQTPTEKARRELDAFFRNHAHTLAPEHIINELEQLPRRYNLTPDEIVVPYIINTLKTSTAETHPALHQYGAQYVMIHRLNIDDPPAIDLDLGITFDPGISSP